MHIERFVAELNPKNGQMDLNASIYPLAKESGKEFFG